MSERHLVVVGASLAGLRAVEAARKTGFTGPITLIGGEKHLPYDRPPLSKAYLEAGSEPESTQFRDSRTFSDELDVTLLLGRRATSLDTARKVVVVDDREGRSEVHYDALVIATGADARLLPGTEGLAGVHSLRTIDDAIAVRAALDANARTVVIGAGFIGSEVAAAARKRGVDVTVVEALATPLVRAVGERLGGAIASLHERNGTPLLCGVGVSAVEGAGRVERVVLSDGTVLPADLVVVGIGAVPATGWLEDSGLTLDNGIVCDENLYTGVEGVYAAGDVARWHNTLFDRSQRLEHWTSAAEQGAVAARNALDPDAVKAYTTVPYFWSDWYGSRIQFVGVPQADEIVVVDGELDSDRWVALYREGDRLVGALTLNGQAVIMKYRGLLMKGATWADALAFAEKRKLAAVVKA
ncbi:MULTISPECIES: NAD(P)/FAD-dependent oxidoreductase [Rhodococcus]|jgi:NADPH-dependent 2,4-dienoyl-CoA reductase/sulfur reductase-like enzyme|uniref:FAD-dependent oxidoreductase n=1 Tax=Rhodococcus qingshengii JCM 15477 TaxID=1303681 RepID=A0AB38RNN0_RHOSG|nr:MULTISPECIES: FAD-dependent oxidoreductase [Rhodococcus]KSU69298.1 pyridine nucleotide-disulfide oxidoreductase [Rhodococcus qingshengii]MDA3635205.1 FAD-dependent oxidoreductase [Rhodococcus sp. C-2]UPU46453.1 FAD-dependent oxidoreductase [Rhodococcus qingshengii JCM 15477]SCC66650.1 Reductase C-terminal [Rhodococcus qingshengii]